MSQTVEKDREVVSLLERKIKPDGYRREGGALSKRTLNRDGWVHNLNIREVNKLQSGKSFSA